MMENKLDLKVVSNSMASKLDQKEAIIDIKSIKGHSPVEGIGTINGYPFLFCSRYNLWFISISLNTQATYDELLDIEESGTSCFYRDGQYGIEPYAASYMPETDVRQLILKVSKEFCMRY